MTSRKNLELFLEIMVLVIKPVQKLFRYTTNLKMMSVALSYSMTTLGNLLSTLSGYRNEDCE
jgi:hypothetical protein